MNHESVGACRNGGIGSPAIFLSVLPVRFVVLKHVAVEYAVRITFVCDTEGQGKAISFVKRDADFAGSCDVLFENSAFPGFHRVAHVFEAGEEGRRSEKATREIFRINNVESVLSTDEEQTVGRASHRIVVEAVALQTVLDGKDAKTVLQRVEPGHPVASDDP